MNKPLVIALVGGAGSGKDTIANMLADQRGWHAVVSYTTRPMRPGETNGKEHHFVDSMPETEHFLAFTEYGGYKYWTLSEQVLDHKVSIYVIDERGLVTLMGMQEIEVCKVYVERDADKRLHAGVTAERIERDNKRFTLPKSTYDFVLKNNKSMSALKHAVRNLISSIEEKYSV